MPIATNAKATNERRKPRYLQLADELRLAIVRGELKNGFPTEDVLTKRFGVSRFTVREALRALQGEGLIQRRRGSGTVIQPAAARGGALHQPLSNVGELLQYARDSRFEFERTHDTGIPPAIEEAIGIEHGGRWVRFRGLRHDAAGVPLAVTDAFLHESIENEADQVRPGAGPIFEQVERLVGLTLSTITQDIQAIAAEAELARELAIDPGSPVLRIIRCYIDTTGRTFEISASYHPGERFAYAVHFEADR